MHNPRHKPVGGKTAVNCLVVAACVPMIHPILNRMHTQPLLDQTYRTQRSIPQKSARPYQIHPSHIRGGAKPGRFNHPYLLLVQASTHPLRQFSRTCTCGAFATSPTVLPRVDSTRQRRLPMSGWVGDTFDNVQGPCSATELQLEPPQTSMAYATEKTEQRSSGTKALSPSLSSDRRKLPHHLIRLVGNSSTASPPVSTRHPCSRPCHPPGGDPPSSRPSSPPDGGTNP
ncbi:unnamed protein product [Ectocarpus fasciculatus]